MTFSVYIYRLRRERTWSKGITNLSHNHTEEGGENKGAELSDSGKPSFD